jgi:hypothetical protein
MLKSAGLNVYIHESVRDINTLMPIIATLWNLINQKYQKA